MSRFAQVWRTSTVRLTATFIAIFIVFAILLMGFIGWQSSVQIQRQQTDDIDREIRLFQRIEANQGIRALAFAVNRLATQPGPGIYFLGDASGLYLLGNITDVPAEVVIEPGVYSFEYERPNPLGEEATGRQREGVAVVRSIELGNGMRLVVGRDVVERRGYSAIILQSFLVGVVGIILFSLIAGGITARRVLRRIDTIQHTSTKIMSGNLSERVPVTDRNDEFDALATNLNAMLDRIEQLLQGLKEVTDNVAHDLKTPLTRLRNQAEAALRDTATAETREMALETVIAESDRLIQTFNALLMIARAEAGAPSGALTEINVSDIVADVAELYGPVAEDAGIVVDTNVEPGVTLKANRELVGQAMVNLLENAVKYARPEDGSSGRISVELRREAGRVRIIVADNGAGIPEADRQRVLERFVRLEKSRSEPGSGLGLSLVNAVARLHGGSLRIEDNAPGVRAVIELPAG
ncbi:HAMP domain-containing histidine kinase [Devosia sp. XJ19-1]|uniref:histidine kinase n=1 Tax=Devosia ureilytica TaxID=2952754 RepID=A0A9Q4AQI1_9HYPH|nr:HAMP domain-containing sensor histidine kinase [Devosia ureilytica]MCP8884229.1 HAMP domain-containing histidine kinase [Devosia ureilytica]MCP8887837.1 HAMP domain-containing histidine kinase [Devosia ureilytica]